MNIRQGASLILGSTLAQDSLEAKYWNTFDIRQIV